jgi:hypothetical protein
MIGKFFGIWFPIMAFVASGFEHSVAYMFRYYAESQRNLGTIYLVKFNTGYNRQHHRWFYFYRRGPFLFLQKGTYYFTQVIPKDLKRSSRGLSLSLCARSNFFYR